jgi:hypothetical protein
MPAIGQITRIDRVSDGPTPRGGPILTTPILIEAQTTGGQVVLEISQDAALKLKEELANNLQARGFP